MVAQSERTGNAGPSFGVDAGAVCGYDPLNLRGEAGRAMQQRSRRETIDHALSRLDELSRERVATAPWQERVRTALNARNDADWEKRTRLIIEALKAVHDGGALDRIEAQVLIAGAIVALAEHRITVKPVPELDRLVEQMAAIEADAGLKQNEFWADDAQIPDAWLKLSQQYDELRDGILATTFNEFGEAELAVSYLTNPSRSDDPYGPARRRRRAE
jgi:hypothetical protein